jgi:hypothetical protein
MFADEKSAAGSADRLGAWRTCRPPGSYKQNRYVFGEPERVTESGGHRFLEKIGGGLLAVFFSEAVLPKEYVGLQSPTNS